MSGRLPVAALRHRMRQAVLAALWPAAQLGQHVLGRVFVWVTRPLLSRVAQNFLTLPPPRLGREPRVTILLLGAYGMGGTIRTVFNLAGYLSHRYDVEVVSIGRRRRRPMLPFPPGVTMTTLDDSFAERATAGGALRAVLGRCPSALVHVQDRRYGAFSLWTDLLLLSFLRDLRGVVITTRPGLNLVAARHAPLATRTIGQEHMNLRSHRAVLRADILKHYPRLDALAVLTESDLHDYSALFESGAPPIVRMPNAVTAIDGPRSDLTARVVVAAGRLTPQKGFDLLLPAWVPVAAAHPDWRLQIYGAGPERARLEALINESGLADTVRLMGRTNRLGHAFSQSSVFVLSSRREGLPMVILEAMSKGLPVVSFDCPTGPAEIVVTDQNGMLVPDGDVEGLSQALLRVIEDDEMRVRLGTGALQTAAGYDIERIGQRWSELIDELAAQPSRNVQSGLGR